MSAVLYPQLGFLKPQILDGDTCVLCDFPLDVNRFLIWFISNGFTRFSGLKIHQENKPIKRYTKRTIKTVSFCYYYIYLNFKLIIFFQVTLHAMYLISAKRIRKLCTGKANLKLHNLKDIMPLIIQLTLFLFVP